MSTSKILEIDLDTKRYKEMYRSFEGAIMSSTIVNIDIEELVFSFSGLIEKRIVAVSEPVKRNRSPTEQPVDELNNYK